MVLSDKEIKELLSKRELVIDPIGEQSIQPASVDCTLGSHFLIIDNNHMPCLDLETEIKYKEIDSDSIVIPSNSFILGTTNEYLEIPDNLVSFVEGRSSIGRMGLFIQNAGWIDPGFKGRITLELYNANSLPIKLKAGRRICQLVFCKMNQKAEHPYCGKYQGQKKTVGSRIYKDAENLK